MSHMPWSMKCYGGLCERRSCVTTKLDLNTSLLAGLPGYIIHRLQLVQNAAAKTVADLKKFHHVIHVL